MKNNHQSSITNYRITRLFLTLGLLALLLASCQPATPTADLNAIQTAAFQTAYAQIGIPTDTPVPTETLVPTATAIRTPPALPGTYQSSVLKSHDIPRSYIADSCQYLKNKWDSTKSAPGTVVMIIMYHSVNKGDASGNDITSTEHKKLMDDLFEVGFQAINMQQMADFMYDNAKIPQRAVLLIVDDRHYESSWNDHFRPYYEQWNWPVVNGWISGLGGTDPVLPENVALSKEGWIDYQAHGFLHFPITDASTDEFITAEIQGSITNLQTYFNKSPVAFIWPGGNFTKRGVDIAIQSGFKLGFTVNPRGPVMYNWIPQADTFNDSNPSAIPEVPAGNPLMTIPRYWSPDARSHIDEVRVIGEDAKAYAEQNKAIELEYYDIVCAPTYGPIP